MKYKSIFTSAFLIIPFCVASGTSSEIFEQVYNYANFNDIESADFNNDGLDDFVALDFWTSDSSYYEVFLSNGDCSFARQGSVNIDTSGFGQILTGDFNEDSCDDMLLMNLEETWFYAGDGTGSFTLDDTFPWSYRNGCTGDVNNDDHLDLVGVNLDSWTGFSEADSAVVMLGDGAGDFSRGWVSRHYYSAYSSCLLAYFSGPSDTILDLCVAGHNNDNYGLLIFQGTGDGSFTDSTFYGITEYFEIDPTYHCTFGDFDEDNYTDIALAGTAGMNHPSVFIFLNQHDGTFESLQEGYFIGGCDIEKIATADLDLDGHLDLSVAGGEGSVAGYGDGTFAFNEFLSNKPYIDFVFMDMDLDGDLDLADKWGCVYRNTTIIQGCEEESAGSMMELILDVSPNPFSASVSIEVSGYFDGSGNLQIFDLSGRLVDELEPASSGGEAVFHWNGVSSSGAELSSGIYTARLSAGNTVTTAALLKLE